MSTKYTEKELQIRSDARVQAMICGDFVEIFDVSCDLHNKIKNFIAKCTRLKIKPRISLSDETIEEIKYCKKQAKKALKQIEDLKGTLNLCI